MISILIGLTAYSSYNSSQLVGSRYHSLTFCGIGISYLADSLSATCILIGFEGTTKVIKYFHLRPLERLQ